MKFLLVELAAPVPKSAKSDPVLPEFGPVNILITLFRHCDIQQSATNHSQKPTLALELLVRVENHSLK